MKWEIFKTEIMPTKRAFLANLPNWGWMDTFLGESYNLFGKSIWCKTLDHSVWLSPAGFLSEDGREKYKWSVTSSHVCSRYENSVTNNHGHMEELQYLVSSFSGDMTFVYFVQTNMALLEPVMHVGTWYWLNQLWPLAAVYCPSSATLTREITRGCWKGTGCIASSLWFWPNTSHHTFIVASINDINLLSLSSMVRSELQKRADQSVLIFPS